MLLPASITPEPTIEELRRLRRAKSEQAESIGDLLRIEDLTPNEKDFLVTCLRICREDRGSDSPGESFLKQLIGSYGYRALTPKMIETLIEEFEIDYFSAMASARKLVSEYPELMQDTVH